MAGLPRRPPPRPLRPVGRPPPRPVRHVARPARVPRAGHPAAAFHALRVREGARKPRFHAARLREPAFSGLLALTAVITAMQTLAFPLVAEFGWTKEIEDRLLAPMPTSYVAAEKVLFAVVRSLIATLIMIPVGILILGSIPWRWAGFPLFVAGLLLGALVGAGFGLLMGTLVQPQRITVLFSLVFTPLLFTGCSQYPWPKLDQIRWFQIVTACNPMTYVS